MKYRVFFGANYEPFISEIGTISRPCPFLAKKQVVTTAGNDSSVHNNDLQHVKKTAANPSQTLEESHQLNASTNAPLHSGIRISPDGQYEVFVNGKSVKECQKGVVTKEKNTKVS
jgi:hypothetical protein